ncbi:MAG: hypothetical protein JST55_13210 [Bacteroidetes bacterium]|nr:hypothetical protein [Bacteroidota bacterium]
MDVIDRKFFFDTCRNSFGGFKASQVEGIDFLLDKFDESTDFDSKSKIAYGFATIKRETADTYKPVNEGYWMSSNRVGKLYSYYSSHNPGALSTIFPHGKNGGNYLGRGYVQLTHNFNYKKLGDALDLELLEDPSIALDPQNAFKIMEYGMVHGSFTGKKLSNYFTDNGYDFYNARKIINGLDAAREIAGHAAVFFSAIKFKKK